MTERPEHSMVQRRWGLVAILVLVLLTYAVYSGVVGHGFITFDDGLVVYENPNVQRGVTPKAVLWAFGTTHSGHWHPVTWLSHMLDCELYGLHPGGHHLSSLLIHILNSVLLFVTFRKMTGRMLESAFVASLFAVHPLNVESVAWVAERKNVLSATFWFLTIWAYAHYVQRPGLGRYLPVLMSFAVGLMTKSMLVTLPFALMLLDYWPLGRFRAGGLSRMVWEKVPLFVLSAAGGFLAWEAAERAGALKSLEDFPLWARVGNATVAYLDYVWKTFWPKGLAVFYPHRGVPPLWEIGLAVGVLGVTCYLALRWRRIHPYLTVGWCWYMGTLVPVIGLVQAGGQAMADRYGYVPLIGLFTILSWGMAELMERWRAGIRVYATVGCLCVFLYAAAARSQASHWQDNTTLFQHALAVTSDNFVAHNNLGRVLAERGRTEEAIVHFKESLRIWPESSVTLNNLGLALLSSGKAEEALPHFAAALQLDPNNYRFHYNAGIALVTLGRLQEGIRHLRETLRYVESAKVHYSLGRALANQGRFEEAIVHYREAFRLNPNDTHAWHELTALRADSLDAVPADSAEKPATQRQP